MTPSAPSAKIRVIQILSQTAMRDYKEPSIELEANLAPGEKIVWRGKPVRGAFVLRTWPLSIFGAVLLLAVVVYEYVVLTTDAPDFLALWSAPFVLAALYMVGGHFLLTAREWKNTEYMVTEKRLLVRHGVFSPRVTIYSLLGLPHTMLEMRGPNVGNLLFKPQAGQGYGPYPGYQTMWPYTPGYLLGLMYIANPREAQEVIEQARRS